MLPRTAFNYATRERGADSVLSCERSTACAARMLFSQLSNLKFRKFHVGIQYAAWNYIGTGARAMSLSTGKAVWLRSRIVEIPANRLFRAGISPAALSARLSILRNHISSVLL